MCQNGTVNGVFRDGGYAEYVLLRTEAVVDIPKDVDPAEFAPQLCAGVTVFNSLRHQNIMPGSTVAVQGKLNSCPNYPTTCRPVPQVSVA